MDNEIISPEKIREINGRAKYWSEVTQRTTGNTHQILLSELNDVIRSLGLSTLWILRDWAKNQKDKECMKRKKCEKCGEETGVKMVGDESYDYCEDCKWVTN